MFRPYPVALVGRRATRATGYGLNIDMVDKFSRYGDLLITVDNGTSAIEEIERSGIDVVVIDHHNAPEELPKKAILVNPKVSDSTHAYINELSSAAICFYIAALLVKELELEVDVREYLDYVAIGTVADVVPLNPLNRIFVVKGLHLLNLILEGRFQKPGIRNLLRISGRREKITSKDISYSIAPRINAAGRIHNPKIALELLIERDDERAKKLAEKLEILNSKRRKITERILKEAYGMALEQEDKPFITVWKEGWHPGILGIVAGRLARLTGKPTAVFTSSGDRATGSVRSVDGVDIYSGLRRISHMFEKWGGHTYAAGITLRAEHLPEFARRTAELFRDISPASVPLMLDMELGIGDVNDSVKRQIELLEPYGEGNPYPVFLSEPVELSLIRLGGGKAHLKYGDKRVVCWETQLFDVIKAGLRHRRLAFAIVNGDINLIDVEE
jgi:single-stranded-DNA-specific exonuclease